MLDVESSTKRSADDARARISLAILIAREQARGDLPFAAVRVPRVTYRLAEAIHQFMSAVAPDVGWMVFDAWSNTRAVAPQLGLDVTEISEATPAIVHRSDQAVFSDLNRLMLKVLLISESPPTWWGGPRDVPEHPRALARLVQVSVAKAYQFSKLFAERGFLTRTRGKMRLVNVPDLLKAWMEFELIEGGSRRIPCQWALGTRGDATPFRRYAGQWAFGGFAACVQLGLLTTPAPDIPDVHVPSEQALSDLDLIAVNDERDAHLVVRIPKHPHSVIFGRVDLSGAYHVDAWQAALDVLGLVRGREQAEYILERLVARVSP